MGVPTQLPLSHLSDLVQGFPSSHGPSTGEYLQTPLLQLPTWHCTDWVWHEVPVSGVKLHLPSSLHLSSVHWLPSSHESSSEQSSEAALIQ